MNDQEPLHFPLTVGAALLGAFIYECISSLAPLDWYLSLVGISALAIVFGVLLWDRFSKSGRERIRIVTFAGEIPKQLLSADRNSILMGDEMELGAKVYLPDSIRTKHVHIIGATGSGKTESVILNFLKQDVSRSIGSIILDAKGDADFLAALNHFVPNKKLKVFDLTDGTALSYNPLASGSPLEASQRLFSSLTWSEEYYRSKAYSALQCLFQLHFEQYGRNPRLTELDHYLSAPKVFASYVHSVDYPQKLAESDFSDLSGLRDQIHTLTLGHLSKILSCDDEGAIRLEDAYAGNVLYFRLQSLLSPETVTILGKLVINHLNYLAGTAHRGSRTSVERPFVPVYFDEFAAFACPEFADLISKARSAGFALHFSHQSVGDLMDQSKGFLSQITDNSATKIVMRINDPDTAEYFARAFGTRLYQKMTQRITNAEEIDRAEVLSEGTQRQAHQFRASPDLFKTLPTGMGSVLVAHGEDSPHGASTVFKIRFPRLSDSEIIDEKI